MAVVVDTNVLIGFALRPASVSRLAVERVLRTEGYIIQSEETFAELCKVALRPKFDRYASRSNRKAFLRLVAQIAVRVEIGERIRACRDPSDDKFLEAAVNGSAGMLITGDRDLLTLDPFRGIQIMTPRMYLDRRSPGPSQYAPDDLDQLS